MSRSSFIQVRVNGVSSLRDVIGKDAIVSLDSRSTVDDLINRLEEEFGSTYKNMTGEGLKDVIKRLFTVSINGKLPTPIRNFNEILSDGDEIVFFQWTGA
jgi:molybdopterin converting factor small subunit